MVFTQHLQFFVRPLCHVLLSPQFVTEPMLNAPIQFAMKIIHKISSRDKVICGSKLCEEVKLGFTMVQNPKSTGHRNWIVRRMAVANKPANE